ncbi:hypothetical protein BDV41DRAFT_575586 [Aspergillus transmontanensis]|uniref:Uncharacterized protein n=1 Tax=Aspergillus transmontanensis TaxID=1034304 RepID=A0A5N6W1C0_9EURO|nr:hypothetical protein BDV41DRAFT_575586 [Aspergillus transmontanensis]
MAQYIKAYFITAYKWFSKLKELIQELRYRELDDLELESIRLKERCRRLQELVTENQQRMEMEIAKKNNDIHLLTERANSLVFQPDPLNDDYARCTMNRLGYSLDTSVNSQFLDEGRLDGLTTASLSMEMRTFSKTSRAAERSSATGTDPGCC